MFYGNVVAVVNIGNRTGDFDGFEIGAGREGEAIGGITQELAAVMAKRDVFDNLAGTKAAIIEVILFVAGKLFMQSELYLLFSISVFASANCSIFNINGLI